MIRNEKTPKEALERWARRYRDAAGAAYARGADGQAAEFREAAEALEAMATTKLWPTVLPGAVRSLEARDG